MNRQRDTTEHPTHTSTTVVTGKHTTTQKANPNVTNGPLFRNRCKKTKIKPKRKRSIICKNYSCVHCAYHIKYNKQQCYNLSLDYHHCSSVPYWRAGGLNLKYISKLERPNYQCYSSIYYCISTYVKQDVQQYKKQNKTLVTSDVCCKLYSACSWAYLEGGPNRRAPPQTRQTLGLMQIAWHESLTFGQLTLGKMIKIVATRCQISRLKCTKFNFGLGSAPDPAGGAYSAHPDLLAGLRGPTSKGRVPEWEGGRGNGGRA